MSDELEEIAKGLAIDPDDVSADALTYSKGRTVHYWRSRIPEQIEGVWSKLSRRERLVAAIMAQVEADREDWD